MIETVLCLLFLVLSTMYMWVLSKLREERKAHNALYEKYVFVLKERVRPYYFGGKLMYLVGEEPENWVTKAPLS